MTAAGDVVQLVTFRVGGHQFAFDVFQVERVLRYEPPRPLPKAPEYLEGTIRHGDHAVPVVDLRKRLEVAAELTEETRIVILEWEQGKVGVVVDAVLEVLRVEADEVSAPPGIVKGLAAEYVSGLVTREEDTLVLLSTSKLLTSQERLALEALTTEKDHE